jgi:hypothetical protein
VSSVTKIRSASAPDRSVTGFVARRPGLVVRLGLVVVLTVGFGVFAGAASAKKVPCGVAIVNDWYGSKTGQLSKVYPLHCYRDALKVVAARADLSVYSNAQQDILLALQQAIAHGRAKPGALLSDLSTADALPSFLGGPDARHGGRPPTIDRPVMIKKRSLAISKPGGLHFASASPVPLAAIILGGIAALLLALGGVGFHRKRKQARF